MPVVQNPQRLQERPVNKMNKSSGGLTSLARMHPIDQLNVYGVWLGNHPTLGDEYLQSVAAQHGGIAWPTFVIAPGTTTAADAARQASENFSKRRPQPHDKLVLQLDIKGGFNHRNALVGSLQSMVFYHFEPHGCASLEYEFNHTHVRILPLIQVYVDVVGAAFGKRATLVPRDQACVSVGPQSVNQRAYQAATTARRYGLCTLWSLLFAKTFLESGGLCPSLQQVREMQSQLGGGDRPRPLMDLVTGTRRLAEGRRRAGLTKLTDMTAALAVRTDGKGSFATSVPMTARQKDAYLPGYVTPADRIARALRAAVRVPLAAYWIDLDGTNHDMRRVFIDLASRTPAEGATTTSLPTFALPLTYQGHRITPPAFAKIVLTIFCKDMDLLPLPSRLAADIPGLSGDASVLQDAQDVVVTLVRGARPEAPDWRTPNAVASAAMYAFGECGYLLGFSRTGIRRVLTKQKSRFSGAALAQAETSLAKHRGRALTLLTLACFYCEATSNPWARSVLAPLLGLSMESTWMVPVAWDEWRATVRQWAVLHITDFFAKRQYTARWIYGAAVTYATIAAVAVSVPVTVLAGPLVGGAISGAAAGGWADASFQEYYRLSEGEAEWLRKLQGQLKEAAFNLAVVTDSSNTVRSVIHAGMRVKEVMLSDNRGSETVWRRSFRSSAVVNRGYH